ncbi:MAG: transglycosylase domain-containing protein [Solirubrobacteraceae bacterium]
MSRRDRQRRRRRNRGSPLKRFFALTGVLIVSAIAVGAIAIAGWVVNVAQSAPNLSSLKPLTPGSPSQLFAADGTSLGYIWSPDVHTAVAGSAIPPILKAATIAIEDRRFYQHGALDYQGILRAAMKDAFSGGTSLQGASTLTMQLVDNLYLQKLRATRDLKYKIVQAKLADQLAAAHSKTWILDGYLNNVPYGTVDNQTAYGVEAAARMFFDKPVGKLSLPQAALLAGLPQAPSLYNPFQDPTAARQRRHDVLHAMVVAGYITPAQAARADRAHLEIKHDPSYLIHNQPYVFDFIKSQLVADLCPKTPHNCPVLNDGLKVYSTIDLRKEAIAQQAILNNESNLASQGGPGVQAALASIDPNNGHVLAIANSSTYSQTTFDYATQAHRQTGSAFKVFALMTLIHDYHASPDSTYYTSKALAAGWLPEAPAWTVHTDTNTYNGTINLTKATYISDNTVYAQLVADEGMDKFNALAHAMGITSPLDDNPAEVLGGLTIGVTPLEMADAYGTVASGGVHTAPTIIDKVVFPDGSVRVFGNPPRTTVFPYNEAYTGTSVLKQVITQAGATGTAANYGCPAAGKTGTAENLANAWFVGYTPRMSTAVWVGNPHGNIAMYNGFGGVLAAPIWKDYMQPASGGYCGDWKPPVTPFVGTAYFGAHSATGAPSTAPGTSGTGSQPQSTKPGGATNGGAGVNGANPYNNPTLYAQPPQSGSGTTPTQTSTSPSPSGGAGAGGGKPKKH